MATVLSEARAMCPELIEAVDILDDLARKYDYNHVFSDLVDWMIEQHLFPQLDEKTLSKQEDSDATAFASIWQIIHQEVKKRVALWTRDYSERIFYNAQSQGSWYDPLGRLYECITSKNKSKMLAQYFTPVHIVDLMVQLNNPGSSKRFTRIFDPACGSGRMGLAAATHAMANKTPCWVTMNDIDPICTKMTAINMCLHGIVGEATCMNGIDIQGHSYRFGYRIVPLLSFIPQAQWELYRMLVFAKMQQDVNKQYVLIPVTYEQTFLKAANDRVLAQWKERQQIAEEVEREKAIEDLKNQIKKRMAGTLFENDTSQLDNIQLPMVKKVEKVKKKQSSSLDGEQQSLF